MEPYRNPYPPEEEAGRPSRGGSERTEGCAGKGEDGAFGAPNRPENPVPGPVHWGAYGPFQRQGIPGGMNGTNGINAAGAAEGMGAAAPFPPQIPEGFLRKWEGRLLRKASNRVCWTMLAAAFLMSCTMGLLAQLLNAFGIRADTGASAFYLPLEFFFLAESLAYLAGLALPPYLLLKLHGLRLQDAVPAERTPFSTAVPAVCFGAFVCTLANYPADWVIQWQQSMGYSGTIPSYEVSAEPAVQALYFFSVAVLPPLVEEFFFRGAVLRMFRRFGDGFAVAASAVLFSLFHGNLAQSVFALICGLVLGFLMVKTNNIWVPVAVHFINNGVSCLWSMLAVSAGAGAANAFSDWITIGILVLGLLSLLLLVFKKRGFFSLPGSKSLLPGGGKVLHFLLNPGCIAFLAYTAFSFLAVMLLY